MSAWIANGSELTQRGRTNLREAVRCTLLASLIVGGAQCEMALAQHKVGSIPSMSSAASEDTGSIPTLDSVQAIGFMVVRETIISIPVALNPGSVNFYIDGVLQVNYPGPLDTHTYATPLPPRKMKSAQPYCPHIKDNPVDVTSGTKHVNEVDFRSISNPELKLSRYMNPSWEGVGIFGKRWVTNFDVKITSEDCDQWPSAQSCQISPNASTIRLYTELGGASEFEKEYNSPTWIPTSGQDGYITRIASGADAGKYLLTTRSSITSPQILFRANGQIERVMNKDGSNLGYTYDAQNRLTKVTHSSGRTVQFSWTSGTPNTVTSITAPNGGVYTFEYQPSWGTHRPMLRKVNYPDGKGNVEYFGGPQLTQININGQPFKKYTYHDHLGLNGNLIKTSSFADGTNLISYDYFKEDYPDDPFVTKTESVNGYGKKTTYLMEDRMLVETIGDASVHCTASANKATYTDDKLLESITNESGFVTRYEYDSKRRKSKQIEAYGTPQQRVTTWQWDEDPSNFFRTGLLKKVTVEGYSSVTYAYRDLDGLLASVTGTNLTSNGVFGASQVVGYSYGFHPNGLVASVTQDGPLPGASDYVKTSYNSQGDLISIENALGQIQTYSGHNGFGQPAKFVDILGAVTEYEYDLRGRLILERVYPNGSPVETRYVYGANGLLDAVTSTDGKAVYRHYDTAHRLTQEEQLLPDGGYDVRRYTYDGMSNPLKIEVGRDE